MDVTLSPEKLKAGAVREEGFTLIESVVAMGLFTGVVFLLVAVFGGLTSDEFPSRTERAVALARTEIAEMQEQRVPLSSQTDTLGFHVDREVDYSGGMVRLRVTVALSGEPITKYATLTALVQSP